MTEKIQDEFRERMNTLAGFINHDLNGNSMPRKVGFCLLVFEFDKIEGGRVNYISNADRKDMIGAMKEYIARNEDN